MRYKTRRQYKSKKRYGNRRIARRAYKPKLTYRNSARVGAFPPHYNAVLRYAYNTELTTADRGDGTYINNNAMQINGLYDFDYSNVWGNGQPPGFDELSALYSRYRVVAVQVKLTIVNKNANVPVRYINWPSKTSVSSLATADGVELATQPGAGKLHTISSSGGPNKLVIKRYLPIYKAMGTMKRTVLGNDDYSANTTANPGEICYLWHSFSSGDTAAQVDVTLEMKFYTRFERLKLYTDV